MQEAIVKSGLKQISFPFWSINEKIIRDQIGFEIIGSKDEKRDDKQIIKVKR